MSLSDAQRKKIHDALAPTVREFIKDQIASCRLGDEGEVIQVCYEALTHELGFVDGMACLAGATKEARELSLRTYLNSGKQECLDQHECPDGERCGGITALRAELLPN